MPRRIAPGFNRGFSLLEVLVAFVILALVLGVIMQIFSGGLRNASLASEYQQAVLLGQSKMAAVGIELPLRDGELSGDFEGGYRWQASIRPYLDPQMQVSAASGAPVPVLPVTLVEIELRVLWGNTMQPRTVTLKTLKLINRSAV